MPPAPAAWRGVAGWLATWWQVLHVGAQMLVLAASPSSHRPAQRRIVRREIYRATWPLLPGFTLLTALFGLVVIRIVLATALSYGLSRYALDVLVRTLVLELLPLVAALFVAVRYSLGEGEVIRRLRLDGGFERLLAAGQDPTRDLVLPRVLAGQFAVVALAAVSATVLLLLTYVSVHGFATWGLPAFTRAVGQVFDPVTLLILGLKTYFMSLAVGVIPLVATPRDATPDRLDSSGRTHAELARLARLLAVILAIEIVSLVAIYH
ncbi:ABC transporter permease [Piscinibacter sakaiensis]|uniref:ABC transporter permease protein n=1 Tax=Piscinibacter sakaiensis TaxID=1547922 RepID=A0A0K8NXZ9_PISS1|nr:ABC transporter permease [Piscinibacter sakaiensis]GAP35154.1 ABC transporter permease protein [Piscinibacter sakaiensis]